MWEKETTGPPHTRVPLFTRHQIVMALLCARHKRYGHGGTLPQDAHSPPGKQIQGLVLTAVGDGHGGEVATVIAPSEGKVVAGASLSTAYSSILSEVLPCVYIILFNFLFKKKRFSENKIKEKVNYGSPARVV